MDMPNDIRIRKATLEDLEAIVQFNAAMAKETEGLDIPPATLRAGARAVLGGRAAAAYYVAEQRGAETHGSGAHGSQERVQQGQEQQQGCDGREGRAADGAGAHGSEAAPAAAAGGGGRIIAQLMITYEWSDWRACDVWWVQSVYVAPPHRRAGHFKALYGAVRAAAAAAGAAGLRLYADVGNGGAHAAYERLGMRSHYKVFEDMFTSY